MGDAIDKLKEWFRRPANLVEEEAEGGEPVTMAPPGSRDPDRETSTNAQTEGARDQPWPGNT